MYQCLAKIHPVNMLSISIHVCTYVGAPQPHSYSSEKSASGQILNFKNLQKTLRRFTSSLTDTINYSNNYM